MKRTVTGILEPGLSTAGLERHNNNSIAEASYQRPVMGAENWA